MTLHQSAWRQRMDIASGPVAYAANALRARSAPRSHDSPDSSQPAEGFVPVTTCAVDLEAPLCDLQFERTPSGEQYGALLALVRLHGDPLQAVEVALKDGCVSAQDLGEALWAGARDEIEVHRAACGCSLATDPSRLSDGSDLRMLSPTHPTAETDDVPFVTVIVPTAGRPERIRACVERLFEMTYPRFEVMVVDNNPADDRTREVVEAMAHSEGRLRYLAEPLPGSSVARNRGVRDSSAEIVAFTDDDVAVDPLWLTWLVRPFVGDPKVGVVTGLVMPSQMDTPEKQWFERFGGFGKGFDPRVFDLGANFASDRLFFPYWGAVFGSGNSMAFRRTVLTAIGGFDPALGAGSPARAGSDIEAFSHAILRGNRLAYEPRAVCWHDHRAGPAALRRQTFNYGVGCTAIFTKWMLRDRRLRLAVVATVVTRARGAATRQRDSSPEVVRLRRQLGMSRDHGGLTRQLSGFALGPILYARSLIWARRLGLRNVLPIAEA